MPFCRYYVQISCFYTERWSHLHLDIDITIKVILCIFGLDIVNVNWSNFNIEELLKIFTFWARFGCSRQLT